MMSVYMNDTTEQLNQDELIQNELIDELMDGWMQHSCIQMDGQMQHICIQMDGLMNRQH